MNQSSIGNYFKVTTWGESHGKAIGAVVEGCPAGLPLCEDDIQELLDRRKPGQSPFATARKETDMVQILSGTFEGRTTGTPISLLIPNTDQRSRDYGDLAAAYRPGHADFGYDAKYGFRDYRGGGRSSGRETAARTAAGAVAMQMLKELGITFYAYTSSIGPVRIQENNPQEARKNPLCMPDANAADQAAAYLEQCVRNGDSAGGVIECRINGVPAGIGEPVFGKLDARLTGAVMSIGAVKAVEIGDGFSAAGQNGSSNNDCFIADPYPDDETAERGRQDPTVRISKLTNHAGGILGGISDGGQIVLRAYVKPTPSISKPQRTASADGRNITLKIKGRHDPVIVPRAVVVVEAMSAIVLADAMLENMGAKMENVRRFYLKQ